MLKTDRGSEYTSRKFDTLYRYHGIKHQVIVSYIPQQNGIVERKNRIIVKMVRSILKERGMSKFFWAEVIAGVIHILNRCPAESADSKALDHAWSRKKSFVSHLCVFEFIAYVHIPSAHEMKLDDKAVKYVFIGYC